MPSHAQPLIEAPATNELPAHKEATMQSSNTARVKPAHAPKKSPHSSWQAQQQKLRSQPRRMQRRLAGKR